MNANEIRGALARGYCHKENENKILDPNLIEAMAQEIQGLICTPQPRPESAEQQEPAKFISKYDFPTPLRQLFEDCAATMADLISNEIKMPYGNHNAETRLLPHFQGYLRSLNNKHHERALTNNESEAE